MNWGFKTWSPPKQFACYVVLIIFFTFLFNHKVWTAEAAAGEHLQQAVFNTLIGAVLAVVLIKARAFSNPYIGALLTTLVTRGFYSSYFVAIAAWEIYFT